MKQIKTFFSPFFLLLLLSACQVNQEVIEVTRLLRTATATHFPAFTAPVEETPLPTFTPVPATSSPIPTATLLPTRTPNPTLEPALWRCMPDGNIDPCQRPLYAIAMLSANEGWMVGDHGAIFYWNGAEWQEQAAPGVIKLHTIVALNSQNVWAAGNEYNGNKDIIHWDGNAWSAHPLITSRPYQGVAGMSFVSENDGWAIIWEYNQPANSVRYLLHWDGREWARPMGIDNFQAVYMLAADVGWASTEPSRIHHWDGKSWERATADMLGETVLRIGGGPHHMIFSAADAGWVIGSSGGIIFWNGNEWHNQEPLPIWSVTGAASFNDQVWVAGFDNSGNLLFHWNGKSWSSVSAPPGGGVRDLAVVSENDIWAVGHGGNYPVIWHWDGVEWTAFHSAPRALPLNAFAMVGENEAWGVGKDGYIGYWDGQQWSAFPSPTGNDLHGVAFIAPDNGWAVGDQATMLHWDGESWTLIKQSVVSPYYTLELQDVAFISATEIWAAGGASSGGPLLIHLQWDGQTWQELEVQTPFCECYFYSIAMLTDTDGWAVGGGGPGAAATVHWDGTTWQAVPNPGNYWFYSLAAIAPDAVWAQGIQNQNSATIPITVRWNGEEWVEEESSLSIPGALSHTPTSETWWKEKWILRDSFWNGASWVPIHNLTTHWIIGADMTPSGQIVVLTYLGTWLRLNE